MSASARAKHIARQRAYAERKATGIKAVPAAWQGLTTANVQQAAKTAFKAVTWHYRTSGQADAQMLRNDLVKAFADLLERLAGDRAAADWVDAWLAEAPSSWTAQYPLWATPQPGEVQS